MRCGTRQPTARLTRVLEGAQRPVVRLGEARAAVYLEGEHAELVGGVLGPQQIAGLLWGRRLGRSCRHLWQQGRRAGGQWYQWHVYASVHPRHGMLACAGRVPGSQGWRAWLGDRRHRRPLAAAAGKWAGVPPDRLRRTPGPILTCDVSRASRSLAVRPARFGSSLSAPARTNRAMMRAVLQLALLQAQ